MMDIYRITSNGAEIISSLGASDVEQDCACSDAGHARVNYDLLPAGRELDALVAEKVLGLSLEHLQSAWVEAITEDGQDGTAGFCCPRCGTGESSGGYVGPCVKRYSTDIAAAWKVVETFFARGLPTNAFSLAAGFDEEDDTPDLEWRCQIGDHVDAYGRTPMLAICRAALKAVEETK